MVYWRVPNYERVLILYYFDLKFTKSERYALRGRKFINFMVQGLGSRVTHIQFRWGLTGMGELLPYQTSVFVCHSKSRTI